MKKVSMNKWEFTIPGPGTINVDGEVEITKNGIEINCDLIPWAEIDAARALLGDCVLPNVVKEDVEKTLLGFPIVERDLRKVKRLEGTYRGT